ncbi:MAG TPA: hypothetical protein GXX36_03985 [Clostridiaceae bacterium]|nr:hypothetical protein [Clostridiaceae bacterium]
MKTHRNYLFFLALITLIALVITGCESNTVAGLIVSDRKYTELSDLENAGQPEQLSAGQNIYASVYFIESPKGMEYTSTWFINGNEVKTDTEKLPTNRKGIIVFSLEGDKVTAGTLKFQVSYKDFILASKELSIVEK